MGKSLSLCMIVKDEEAVLGRCLAGAVPFCDEIIIADTGSKDKTKEIAAMFTDKVYDYEWADDFGAARNFSFSKATSDYIMWLDADDVVTPENAKKIKKLLEDLDADVVMCIYDTAFDLNGKPTFSYYRERILRRETGFMWEGFVHEAITPRGKIIYSDISVEHKKAGKGSGARNLNIYEKKLKEGAVLEPRHQFYYARELYYNRRYRDAVAAFKRFLENNEVYLPNVIDAHIFLKRAAEALGESDKGLEMLLGVFKYTLPNAEITCEIASFFAENGDYQKAAYWYKEALQYKPEPAAGGFVNLDYYGLIPFLGLCFCYDRLGDKITARRYNDLAAAINPEDERVLYNKRYFDSLNLD